MGSGDYSTRFIHQVCTQAKGSAEGTFSDSTTYWGSLEPISAREQFAHGLMGSFVEFKVRLPQKVNIKNIDRFKNKETNEVYRIHGHYFDKAKNETVAWVQLWRE